MRHLFIVNPVAGGKDKTAEISAQVEALFANRAEPYEVYVTRAPRDACDKVRAAAEEETPLRVYACGGDGTLNECVSGAVGLRHVSVTQYPCGTGNDFAKLFGKEKGRFLHLEELVEGEVRPLDVMSCNERCCVNICSVGVDARIGTQVHQYSNLPLLGGVGGYLVSLVVNVVRGITQKFKISACGQEFDGDFTLVCVCNGQYYGGFFRPVTFARPDDGLLDILVVKEVTRRTFFRLVARYAKGEFQKFPKYITHLRGRELHLESEEPFVINLDGEAIFDKTLDLRLLPGAVNFVFPKGLAFFENEKEEHEGNRSKWEISVT